MSQLLIGYPSIAIYCKPHIKQLLTKFVKRNDLLHTDHFMGRLLRDMLEDVDPDWNFAAVRKHHTEVFNVHITHKTLRQYGSSLSPEKTKLYNALVDDWFNSQLVAKVNELRSKLQPLKTKKGFKPVLNEMQAIQAALQFYGIDETGMSDDTAHKRLMRYEELFVN